MVAALETERADVAALRNDCHPMAVPFLADVTRLFHLLRHLRVNGGCFRVTPALVYHRHKVAMVPTHVNVMWRCTAPQSGSHYAISITALRRFAHGGMKTSECHRASSEHQRTTTALCALQDTKTIGGHISLLVYDKSRPFGA